MIHDVFHSGPSFAFFFFSVTKTETNGKQPLYHNGDIWLTYSGSFCGTPNYGLGLLYYNGGDPLQKSSWEKTGPVFTQGNGRYGTGHNCAFLSPDKTQVWVC